ncbi:hypothetical protein GCM10027167_77390 [Nocardia heshunensis]
MQRNPPGPDPEAPQGEKVKFRAESTAQYGGSGAAPEDVLSHRRGGRLERSVVIALLPAARIALYTVVWKGCWTPKSAHSSTMNQHPELGTFFMDPGFEMSAGNHD